MYVALCVYCVASSQIFYSLEFTCNFKRNVMSSHFMVVKEGKLFVL